MYCRQLSQLAPISGLPVSADRFIAVRVGLVCVHGLLERWAVPFHISLRFPDMYVQGGGSLARPRASLRLFGIFVDQGREGEEIRVHIGHAGHSSVHGPGDMQSCHALDPS